MKKKKIISKIGLPIIYISIWIIIYNLPRRIFYNNSGEDFVIFLIVCFLLPFFLSKAFEKNGIGNTSSNIIGWSSVFLVIPFIMIIDSEGKKELEEYRRETFGVVSKSWMKNQVKKSDIRVVKGEYQVNGKEYQTSSKDDKNMILKVGDRITIIYSSKTPEICEIKELIEHYGK